MSLFRLLLSTFFSSKTPSKTEHAARDEQLPPFDFASLQVTTEKRSSAVMVVHTTEIVIQKEIRTTTAPAEHKLVGKCYVVDGDTIQIHKTSIRLAGIDAPELDQPYGLTAKRHLMNLTRGQEITANIIEDDHHGRVVANCYLQDGRDLAAEMVKAGLAIDWKKHSGGKYRSLEPEGVRRKLWRCDARQKGRMPPPPSHPD